MKKPTTMEEMKTYIRENLEKEWSNILNDEKMFREYIMRACRRAIYHLLGIDENFGKCRIENKNAPLHNLIVDTMKSTMEKMMDESVFALTDKEIAAIKKVARASYIEMMKDRAYAVGREAATRDIEKFMNNEFGSLDEEDDE